MVDATNFIDAHIPSTRVLIEQKSLGKDLRKGNLQGDGSILNPFQQAKKLWQTCLCHNIHDGL